MNMVVLNGTLQQGCTYRIKEAFLAPLRKHYQIREFYVTRDLSALCIGCKNCFILGEHTCPHAAAVAPIWEAIVAADVLLIAYPIYAGHMPAALKNVFDHLSCHWLVHRPHPAMFEKRAVLLTNSLGIPNSPAQKEVRNILQWMGISEVRALGVGLYEDAFWEKLSDKRRRHILKRTLAFAKTYQVARKITPSVRVRLYFALAKRMQRSTIKRYGSTADNRYWEEQGWL